MTPIPPTQQRPSVNPALLPGKARHDGHDGLSVDLRGAAAEPATFRAECAAYKAVMDWVDADTGRNLVGCTPSMIAGVAINAYRDALKTSADGPADYAPVDPSGYYGYGEPRLQPEGSNRLVVPTTTDRAYLITSRDDALKQAYRWRRHAEELKASLIRAHTEIAALTERITKADEVIVRQRAALDIADEVIERLREEISELRCRLQELEWEK